MNKSSTYIPDLRFNLADLPWDTWSVHIIPHFARDALYVNKAFNVAAKARLLHDSRINVNQRVVHSMTLRDRINNIWTPAKTPRKRDRLLVWALYKRRDDVIALLLEDSRLKPSKDDNSALRVAIVNHQEKFAELIIQHPRFVHSDDFTREELVCMCITQQYITLTLKMVHNWTPPRDTLKHKIIETAVKSGNTVIIDHLLDKWEINPRFPLLVVIPAVENGLIDVVRRFLPLSIHECEVSMHVALAHGQRQIVQMLEQETTTRARTVIFSPILTVGSTLHHAVEIQNIGGVKLTLEIGDFTSHMLYELLEKALGTGIGKQSRVEILDLLLHDPRRAQPKTIKERALVAGARIAVNSVELPNEPPSIRRTLFSQIAGAADAVASVVFYRLIGVVVAFLVLLAFLIMTMMYPTPEAIQRSADIKQCVAQIWNRTNLIDAGEFYLDNLQASVKSGLRAAFSDDGSSWLGVICLILVSSLDTILRMTIRTLFIPFAIGLQTLYTLICSCIV